MNRKKRVLFYCKHNSCRSQMAEALLRNRAGDVYEVFSAGLFPGTHSSPRGPGDAGSGPVDRRTNLKGDRFFRKQTSLRSHHHRLPGWRGRMSGPDSAGAGHGALASHRSRRRHGRSRYRDRGLSTDPGRPEGEDRLLACETGGTGKTGLTGMRPRPP
ncbi:MAG TPA: hypothetical protein ENN17_06685 [bacterium]|nr:hypothetical protein [bacterium]